MERIFDIASMAVVPSLFTTIDAAASISLPCLADILALLNAEAEKTRSAAPKTDKTRNGHQDFSTIPTTNKKRMTNKNVRFSMILL